MSINLTPEFIRNALRNKHANYNATISEAERLSIHANGEVPRKLIEERRPSESKQTKDYRVQIYVSQTENPIGKVVSSLQKIRRSQDWNIQYDDKDMPSQIAEQETLEQYCEFNYPGFTSVTNWVFSELLSRYIIDANAVVAVIPKRLPNTEADYMAPVAEFFSSKQVVDYAEDEYCVLKSADKSVYYSPAGKKQFQGDIFYIITATQLLKYEQVNGKGDLSLSMEYNHNFGYVPAIKVKGIFKERVNNDTIYKSRIGTMVPHLNEAAREYSDLQAEIVQHIHSEKYFYANTECPVCKGTSLSKEKDENGTFKQCPNCEGKGVVRGSSVYGEYMISPSKFGEHEIPAPPIGYIQKDTDIARLQDERVDKHIHKALASINMEFLSVTPLSQSGIAKEVDRDELNNFVNSIAEDLVRIMDEVYRFICDYRYIVIVPDKEKRQNMLPSIQVPEKFDLLSSKYLMEEIQAGEASNINPVLKKYLEVEYARKKYNADPQKAYELESICDLDPLYGYSQDEKASMLSTRGVSEIDYIISCNIIQFVIRAVDENDKFHELSLSDRRKIVAEYANEVVKANSLKENIRKEIDDESGEDTE